jgi:hypothetical protein
MTETTARRFLQTGLAMAALFVATGSRAETLDQLYEKAKLEKTVVFYSGGRPRRTRAAPRRSWRSIPESPCR